MVLISQTEKQEREIAIAVTFYNLSENLLLMDAPRHSVRLLVSDTPSTLQTIDAKETFCLVDLSGLDEGTHTLTVRPADVGLPTGVALKAVVDHQAGKVVPKDGGGHCDTGGTPGAGI